MAAKVLEANPPEIALAMSVAPVTDWRYYGMLLLSNILRQILFIQKDI
jgi:hypothetical protein